MIKFEHTEVFNFEGALRGMRNSWESWEKSDSQRVAESGEWWFEIGEADMKLALNLVKAGNDHAKFLRQIFISVDIVAPEYFWKEADTYKVGTVANSTSMMHTLGKRPLTIDDFSFDDSEEEHVLYYMDFINELRQQWIDSGKKKPSPEWRLMNQLTAISFIYRRTWTANYQVLRSMYFSRKNHRLEEWHEFARWVESLPYSELITAK